MAIHTEVTEFRQYNALAQSMKGAIPCSAALATMGMRIKAINGFGMLYRSANSSIDETTDTRRVRNGQKECLVHLTVFSAERGDNSNNEQPN